VKRRASATGVDTLHAVPPAEQPPRTPI
jgi:hypothetical protein